MKKVLGMLLFAVMLTSVSCTQNQDRVKSEPTPDVSVGVLVDANVIPTSFNESCKTQVKTDQRFFVVYGFPQLTIGEEVVGKMNQDGALESVVDISGKRFRVVK